MKDDTQMSRANGQETTAECFFVMMEIPCWLHQLLIAATLLSSRVNLQIKEPRLSQSSHTFSDTVSISNLQSYIRF
jgi:hypothetical protein